MFDAGRWRDAGGAGTVDGDGPHETIPAVRGDRSYEVVVDRSIGVAEARAQAPAPSAGEEPRLEPEPAAATGSEPEAELQAAILRRVSLRRAGRWLRCEVALRRSVEAERVRCRLFRNGRLVAHAS